MSKTSKAERTEVYKDHRVQLFLSKFVSGELSELNPVYDPKYGYKYPVVEAIVGEARITEEFLKVPLWSRRSEKKTLRQDCLLSAL